MGKGIYYDSITKCTREGEWKYNLLNGMGREVVENLSSYEGHFKDSVYWDHGVMTYADG